MTESAGKERALCQLEGLILNTKEKLHYYPTMEVGKRMLEVQETPSVSYTITMPGGQGHRKLQLCNPVMETNGPEPSEKKVWIMLPGKEPQLAGVLAETNENLE